jgi:tripartite-type tricarboxylate transporter receptor subunit TctC
MHRGALVCAATAIVLACAVATGPVAAQTADTIRLIYPFAAGGSGDGMARLIADRISAGLSDLAQSLGGNSCSLTVCSSASRPSAPTLRTALLAEVG